MGDSPIMMPCFYKHSSTPNKVHALGTKARDKKKNASPGDKSLFFVCGMLVVLIPATGGRSAELHRVLEELNMNMFRERSETFRRSENMKLTSFMFSEHHVFISAYMYIYIYTHKYTYVCCVVFNTQKVRNREK